MIKMDITENIDDFSDLSEEVKEELLGAELEEVRRTQYVLMLRRKAAIASHNQAQLKVIESEEARIRAVLEGLLAVRQRI